MLISEVQVWKIYSWLMLAHMYSFRFAMFHACGGRSLHAASRGGKLIEQLV